MGNFKPFISVIVILFCVVFWASLFHAVHGQIRSDFVLSEEGVEPKIAIDKNGKIHATWEYHFIVFYALFDSSGNPIRTPQILRNGRRLSRYQRIAVSGDHAVVVWFNDDFTASGNILGQLFTIDGDTVFDKIIFNGIYTFISAMPDVSFVNDSTLFCIWRSFFPSGIFGQIVTTSLRPIGTNLQLIDATQVNTPISFLSIAANPQSDNVIVVWREVISTDNEKVYGRLFSKLGISKDSTFLICETLDQCGTWSPSVALNEDGHFMVAWSFGRLNSDWNIYLRKFYEDGTPYGPSERINEKPARHSASVDISVNKNGRFVVVWEEKLDGKGYEGYIIAQRFETDGTSVGGNFKVGSATDTLDQIYPDVVLHDNKIVTVWTALREASGSSSSIWASIIDFDNPPSQVKPKSPHIPKSFILHQNYPNPFNSKTMIRYEVLRRSHVSLVIFNPLGETIIELVNKEVLPGNHEVRWDAKNVTGGDVSSGIYICQLNTGGIVQTKKLVLIK